MYINDEIKRLRLKVNREKVYEMVANLIAAKIHEMPSVRKELRDFVFRQGEFYVSLKSEVKKTASSNRDEKNGSVGLRRSIRPKGSWESMTTTMTGNALEICKTSSTVSD